MHRDTAKVAAAVVTLVLVSLLCAVFVFTKRNQGEGSPLTVTAFTDGEIALRVVSVNSMDGMRYSVEYELLWLSCHPRWVLDEIEYCHIQYYDEFGQLISEERKCAFVESEFLHGRKASSVGAFNVVLPNSCKSMHVSLGDTAIKSVVVSDSLSGFNAGGIP